MTCPRCGSDDRWHDNLWWGCNHCGFACHSDPAGVAEPTFIFAKDLPGLAKSMEEMKARGQWPPPAAEGHLGGVDVFSTEGANMEYLKLLQSVVMLLPTLAEAVKSIEALFPESGQGQKKLEAVRGMMEDSYKVAGETAGAFQQIWPIASGAVGSLVKLYNQTGAFQHDDEEEQDAG
jgi:hypothetical protein